jgi:type IV secretory pathway VirJ component
VHQCAPAVPADLQSQIATVSLLGLDSTASFAISVADWIGNDTAGLPTRPELANLGNKPVLCIYGQGEQDSICPSLQEPHVRREQVGTGHHFGGEYAQLAQKILTFARNSRPMT